MTVTPGAQPSLAATSSLPGSVRVGLVLAAADLAIGLLVLVGWLTGRLDLASLAPGLPSMKASTAVALLACAGGLVLVVGPRTIRRPALGRLLAAVAGVLAAVALFEHLSGIGLGVDQLVFRDPASVGTPYPGRMAVQTALAFEASALAIVLLGRRWRGVHPSQLLGVAAALLGGGALLGYAYGAEQLTSLASASRISLWAAIALPLLGAAIIAADPSHGLVQQIRDPGPAGQFARLVLPAAALVVPIGGWLRLQGERAGLYDPEVGVAIMAIFEVCVLLALGAYSVQRVLRLEAERGQARRERDRFFELSTDLVCVIDSSGRFVLASPSWQGALGYSLAELSSLPFIERVHPDDRERTLAEFERELVEPEPVVGFRNRYVRKDGSYRWIEWNSMPDPAEGRLYAVARDVTEQRQAEEDRARLVAIVASSLDAIIATDLAGTITDWNRGAEQMFGYTAADAIGKPLGITAPAPERQAQHEHLQAAAAGAGVRYVAVRRRKDGSTFPADLSTFPVRSADGKVIGLSTVARDVTDVVEARQALERSAAELARSNQELEQFAYVASHDLQEPLRMVTGFVGLLQKRYGARLSPEADEYIGFAVDGARRMQSLINDLLAYSRVGTRGADARPTDLAGVVEEAELNLRVAIEEARATLRCERLPVVLADRRQMVQLYQNLVGNAVKFRSERPCEVELGAERDGDTWRLYVRDNGIGIAPEHADQIFAIFRRLHSRETYPGSGIGLAICKKIVERHGGRIWLDSAPGAGATFWFTLPAAEGLADGG